MLRMLKKIIFQKDKLRRFRYACQACFRSPNLYPFGKYPDFDVEACAENYINNIKTAKYYAGLLGAKYLNFLQPYNGSGRRQMTKFDISATAHILRRMTQRDENELDLIARFYDMVWQKIRDEDYAFDLRNIFDNYGGEVYFDQTHCSDIGYDIIARKIAEQVVQHEAFGSREKKEARK